MLTIPASSRAVASRLGRRCAPVQPFLRSTHQSQGSHASQSQGPAPVAAQPVDRASHDDRQRQIFNDPATISHFTQPLPADVEQRLSRIVQAVPGLGPSSRIIDVGTGTGCLVPHFQARGVTDVLAVDLADNMLEQLRRRFGAKTTLGNETGLRTWCGDVVDLPSYMGPADAFFFNSVFGNVHSQREALLRAALLLRPGGHIVLSHSMGRAWHCSLRQQDPSMVPHELPLRPALEELVADLPLQVVEFVDEPDLYMALLQVPPQYRFKRAPLYLSGPVVPGFGRGSSQMGVPTANIDPAPLAETLKQLPRGVYFGWARLDVPAGGPWSEEDRAVHKMVMNVGRRPTVSEGDDGVKETVEVHIMHKFPEQFYGQPLKIVALGYLRPEVRFAGGIKELIARIRADIAISKNQLDEPNLAAHRTDAKLH